jgi:mono/diheme cytochrome c family protein
MEIAKIAQGIRMGNVKFFGKILLVSLAILLKGCGFNHPKMPFPDSAQSSPVSFSYLTQNIFIPKCSDCHGTNMGNYGYLMNRNYIVPGSAESSLLYQLVSTGEMPKNGQALRSDEVSAIYEWIQAGAKE